MPEDAFVSKATPQVKGRYLTRSGGSVNKRYSLPGEIFNRFYLILHVSI